MESPETLPQHENSKKETKIWLITPDQFYELPKGTELISLSGKKMIKGQDTFDDDTRNGYLAYGFFENTKPANITFNPKAVIGVKEK